MLEKNGLGPVAGILENYGIDSETDLLVLDQDDFSKLASRGLKPLYAKKLERWCGAERDAPNISTTQFRIIECGDASSTFGGRGGIGM